MAYQIVSYYHFKRDLNLRRLKLGIATKENILSRNRTDINADFNAMQKANYWLKYGGNFPQYDI